MEIDTANKYLVGKRAGDIVILNPPRREMSKADALMFAAWIVALAEDKEGEFQTILDAVQSI